MFQPIGGNGLVIHRDLDGQVSRIDALGQGDHILESILAREVGALIPVAVAGALFALVIVLWVVGGPGSEPPADALEPDQQLAEPGDSVGFSFAVLPVLLAPDAAVSAATAEELTRLITRALPEMDGVRVAPLSAAAVYPQGGARPGVAEISQALGVRYVLQARIEGGATDIQIRAQLADGKTGEVLWSRIFRAQLDSVLDIYVGLTEAVWDEFDLEFSGLL